DLVASLPLIKERILVIILLLHFLSLMLGSVLVLMLPLLVWLTPDLRSEERFSRNAETDLVCRLLLEKKNVEFTGRVDVSTLRSRPAPARGLVFPPAGHFGIAAA